MPKAHLAPKATSLLPTGKNIAPSYLQGYPSGRLPRFARNDRVLRTERNKSLFTRIYLQNFRAIFILSRATHLCHCEAPPSGAVAIARKGHLVKSHARYFCTCVEKKAHTSKRVSIIACNNAISKVQCAPCGRDTLLFFGKVYERLAFSFCKVQRLRRSAEIVVDKKHDKIRFFHNVFVAF